MGNKASTTNKTSAKDKPPTNEPTAENKTTATEPTAGNKVPTPANPPTKDKTPKKPKKLFFLITGIIILLLLSLVGVFFYLKTKTFEITFDSDGGTAIEKIVARANAEIELPETTKTGFIFTGWTMNGETVPPKIILKDNLNLKATWIQIDQIPETTDPTTEPTTEEQSGEQAKQPNQPNQPTQPSQPEQSTKPSQQWQFSPGAHHSTLSFTCPAGYTLTGIKCIKIVTTYKTCTCPASYSLVNSGSGASKICQKYSHPRPSCKDVTYSTDPRNNAWCLKENACFLKRTPHCKGNSWRFDGKCYDYKVYVSEFDVTSYLVFCDEGNFVAEVGQCVARIQPTCTCPTGYTEQNKICKKIISIPATIQ